MTVRIDKDLAKKDFEKVLACRQAEMEEDQKGVFIQNFERGIFSLGKDENGNTTLVQQLKFPVKTAESGKIVHDKIVYSLRVKTKTVRQILSRMDSNDTNAEQYAYFMAASGLASSEVDEFDVVDSTLCRLVSVLFVQ